jgi:hypothetical protein
MFKLLFKLLFYLTRLLQVTFSAAICHQISDLMEIGLSGRPNLELCLYFIQLIHQRYNAILWWVSYKMSLKIERQIWVRFPVECQRYFLITLFNRNCTPRQSPSLFRWSGVKFSAYLHAIMSGLSYLFFIFSINLFRKFPQPQSLLVRISLLKINTATLSLVCLLCLDVLYNSHTYWAVSSQSHVHEFLFNRKYFLFSVRYAVLSIRNVN